MKNLKSLLAICLLYSCGKLGIQSKTSTSLLTVVYDITDPLKCIPCANPILKLYDFQSYKDQLAQFRLVPVSDKKLNPIREVTIENSSVSDQNNVNEEMDYRENLVLAFYDSVRMAINDFQSQYTADTSLHYSECYSTIATELEILASRNASKKILIVFSDLFENSVEFSCYTYQGLSLLKNNPEKVEAILLRQHPLPDNLQGIMIYAVYNPDNRENDILFSKMATVYKHMMTSRGATIKFQATNKYFQ